MKSLSSILILLMLVSASLFAQSTPTFFWKDGLRMETEDVQLKVGAVIQNDWTFMREDDGLRTKTGVLQDGTQFRRARLYVAGTVYQAVDFKAQYEFAKGDVAFRDLYFGLSGIPVLGSLRIGQFKEPFGMEQLTSGNNTPFLERGLPDVFSPSRNPGILAFHKMMDERVTWAVGVFKNGTTVAKNTNDANYHVTARITGLPVYENDGGTLVHLGGAFSRRNPLDEKLSVYASPETNIAPKFVDTGVLPAGSNNLMGGEVAGALGTLAVQGEYVRNTVRLLSGGDVTLNGYYVMAGYVLTGEKKSYNRKDGVFGSIKPKSNFTTAGGSGAVELLVRYSSLDLTDGSVTGGRLQDVTVGLNWYLNPVSKVMVNYTRAKLIDAGSADIVQCRFQVAF